MVQARKASDCIEGGRRQSGVFNSRIVHRIMLTDDATENLGGLYANHFNMWALLADTVGNESTACRCIKHTNAWSEGEQIEKAATLILTRLWIPPGRLIVSLGASVKSLLVAEWSIG
jgi:hypothetical protein